MQQGVLRGAARGLPLLPARQAKVCGKPLWKSSSGKQSSLCRAYVPGLELIQQLTSTDGAWGVARTALRLRPESLFLDSVPHTSIIQEAPHGATEWFIIVCSLSVALGAALYAFFNVLQSLWEIGAKHQSRKDPLVIYGVDVSGSAYFRDPRLLKAVEFAATAHAGQKRKTGEPYVSHCIETALIVEHNLPPLPDYERHVLAMVAAVLHDVLDDANVDPATIEAKFGPVVAANVSKVSKLSQMNQLLRRGKRKGWAEYSPQHFKSLRKMIVDMVFEEPLVILIKLADRLHNMRTVFVLKPDKQKAVAEETMEVWCTMAECLGWDALKSEMEDLCFAVLAPEQYCALRTALDRLWSLPTLKVVEEQADSSQLPPNALAPAPPLTARGRKAAAAAAARREAANSRAAAAAAAANSSAAQPVVSKVAAEPVMQRVPAVAVAGTSVVRQPVSAAAISSSPSATRGAPVSPRSGASPSGSTVATLVRPAPAATMVAVADPPASGQSDMMGGQGEPAPFMCPGDGDTPLSYTGAGSGGSSRGSKDPSRGWAGSSSGGSDISLGEVNLGIRITATPGPEVSGGGGGARWDLVSWSLPCEDTAGSGDKRSLQPRLVTLEPGGPIGSSAQDLPGASSGGGYNLVDSSSVVTDKDMEELQRHLDRLQSHAGAGPGPASHNSSSHSRERGSSTPPRSHQPEGSPGVQDVGDSGMQRIMFDFSFDAAAATSFDSAGEDEPEPHTGGQQRKAPPQMPLLPARFLPPGLAAFLPLLTPTALSSSMPNDNSHHPPESAGASNASQQHSGQQQQQQQQQGSQPSQSHHQAAGAAAREIASGAAALASRIIAAAHSQGSAVAAAARRATPVPAHSKPSKGTHSTPQQHPEPKKAEHKAEVSPTTSNKPAGLPGLGLMPLTPGKSSGSGGPPGGQGSGVLTEQQERLQSLVSTVVPFDSVNFKDSRRNLSISARRGLEVLDQCAELLYAEVQLRSTGGGLSLQIQGRLKSLQSVYRKMVRKGCSVAEVYDARALRVIVGDDNGERVRDAVETCYKLVSTVHSIWKPIPNEFDDYISNPKPSGYQALHTAVKGPGGVPMEVQIKTASMHYLAEYGAAAHWVYKEYSNTSIPVPIAPLPSVAMDGRIQGRAKSSDSNSTSSGTPAGTSSTKPAQPQRKAQEHPALALPSIPFTPPALAPRVNGTASQAKPTHPHTPPDLFNLPHTSDIAGAGAGAGDSSTGAEPGRAAAAAAVGRVKQRLTVASVTHTPQGSILYRFTEAGGTTQVTSSSTESKTVAALEAARAATGGGADAGSRPNNRNSPTSTSSTASTTTPALQPRIKGRGWVGQPVLRIAKDKLRYGVVVKSSREGTQLLVAVKNGPTSAAYPTRVNDYGFYRAMVEYVESKGWIHPGRGDFTLRVEEYVLANDGRYHRQDHMGYLIPAESLTLLEGFEEEATALLARQAEAGALMARGGSSSQASVSVETPEVVTSLSSSEALGSSLSSLAADTPPGAQGTAPSSASSSVHHAPGTASASHTTSASGPATSAPASTSPVAPLDPAAERVRRQMQQAYLRTQQLRTMIEWGRDAMGRYHQAAHSPGVASSSDGDDVCDDTSPSSSSRSPVSWCAGALVQDGAEPGDEVSVLIWPGGTIEHWPRGTTVAQVVRAKGVHSLSASLPEPRDVRPSATAVAGGDDGWLLALGARTSSSGGGISGQGGPDGVGGALFGGALDPDMLSPPALVNVNNRLVPETTVLNDGDLVILARERVKI